MTADSTDESTTPEFAFEPPAMGDTSATTFDSASTTLKTPSYTTPGAGVSPTGFTPNGSFQFQAGGGQQQYPPYNYSSTSSSFSTNGTSYSGDALPAISRDFVRPSTSETRRPATAGGALQSQSPFENMGDRFQRIDQDDGKPETIDEAGEGIFSNTNPFGSPEKEEAKIPSEHYMNHRRASEPHFQPLSIQTSWSNPSGGTPEQPSTAQSPHNTFPLTSAPAHVTQFGFLGGNAQMSHLQRPGAIPYHSRPQTSDGLPSYGHLNPGGVSLPSARTIVNQIDPSTGFAPPQYGQPLMPFRDCRAASMSELHQAPQNAFPGNRHYSMDRAHMRQKDEIGHPELTFVPLGGPAPKKRPRRRFDEIERLYQCGWNGCEKAYGTLNHLNAHVAMQKHGEKRLPSEFKDMRKAWRKKKREHAAAHANAQYMQSGQWGGPHRPSISASESDFDRRDSTATIFSANSDYSHRGSLVYAPNYGWAPDGSRPNTSSSMASSADGRFVPVPAAYHQMNPMPIRRPSMPMPAPQAGQGFRQGEGDQPTPTQQHPFPARPGSSEGNASFPFQTLTSPMPMAAGTHSYGGGGNQFAFQR